MITFDKGIQSVNQVNVYLKPVSLYKQYVAGVEFVSAKETQRLGYRTDNAHTIRIPTQGKIVSLTQVFDAASKPEEYDAMIGFAVKYRYSRGRVCTDPIGFGAQAHRGGWREEMTATKKEVITFHPFKKQALWASVDPDLKVRVPACRSDLIDESSADLS